MVAMQRILNTSTQQDLAGNIKGMIKDTKRERERERKRARVHTKEIETRRRSQKGKRRRKREKPCYGSSSSTPMHADYVARLIFSVFSLQILLLSVRQHILPGSGPTEQSSSSSSLSYTSTEVPILSDNGRGELSGAGLTKEPRTTVKVRKLCCSQIYLHIYWARDYTVKSDYIISFTCMNNCL